MEKEPNNVAAAGGKQFPIKFVYHGRTIVLGKIDDSYTVSIDGEGIPIERATTVGFIATSHSPYSYHETLEGLAMSVTDHVINMRCNFPNLLILQKPTF
jgi:hypothetical protein